MKVSMEFFVTVTNDGEFRASRQADATAHILQLATNYVSEAVGKSPHWVAGGVEVRMGNPNGSMARAEDPPYGPFLSSN